MARIFKPKFPQRQTALGPDGKPVMVERIAKRGKNKGKPLLVPKRELVRGRGGKPKYQESKKWYVEYRDALGVLRRIPGYTDKRATLQLAAELERRASHEDSGLVDRFAKHRKRPLFEHLEDWQQALRGKGDSPYHVEVVIRQARAVIDGCMFTFWPDISASRVQGFIGGLRDNGAKTRTRNFYLAAIKQFCNWAVKDGRVAQSPLTHLQSETVDDEDEKGIFTPAELQKLIRATETGPPRSGMSGPDRAVLYLIASETGFRAGELRKTTRECVQREPAIRPYRLAYLTPAHLVASKRIRIAPKVARDSMTSAAKGTT